MHEHRNSNFIIKTNTAIVTAVKDASCDRGWVRYIMQGVFGIITVASFFLILKMSIQRTTTTKTTLLFNPRCISARCMVTCSGVPRYGKNINDIIETITNLQASSRCKRITLSLYNAQFTNNTMPENWLSNVVTEVNRLTLVGGNLQYIKTGAFMSEFFKSVDSLHLEDVALAEWQPDMLLGLQSLAYLEMKDCRFNLIHSNALRAVDETLESLQIINSGNWTPVNLTGSSYPLKLNKINFSQNNFKILSSDSFTRIDKCKFLDLSSSGVTGIQPHTFDFISEIEEINLSNNLIMSLPDNLFSRILLVGASPRIDLYRNRWHCDCKLQNLISLLYQGVLTTEPLCQSPSTFSNKPISDLQGYCTGAGRNRTTVNQSWPGNPMNEGLHVEVEMYDRRIPNLCQSNNNESILVSPLRKYRCPMNTLKSLNLYKLFKMSKDVSESSLNLKPAFYVSSGNLTMLEFTTHVDYHTRLIWFQANCTSIVYCLDVLPRNIKIYNVAVNNRYVFCPAPKSGSIEPDDCIMYRTYNDHKDATSMLSIVRFLLYGSTVILGIFFGAALLYGIIRKNPTLLKGSKRVLLVKHKVADAIILPSKLLFNDKPGLDKVGSKKKDGFLEATEDVEGQKHKGFKQSFSIRSSKSNAPSYISALQPTEDQLKEWRLKHHFDNSLTFTSISSSECHVSCIYDGDLFHYLQSESTGSCDSGTSKIISLE